MHKGRYVPRVHPFALSCGWTPPYFAAVHVAPTGFFVWDSVRYDFSGTDWGAAAVFPHTQTITWEGEIDFGEVICWWQLVQSYVPEAGRHSLVARLRDQFGALQQLRHPVPTVAASFDGSCDQGGIWTVDHLDNPPWQRWPPTYALKPWR